ncbi:lysophospholipid acyltransferase family protein [Paludisphaera borealis]|uniref:Lipid A biosynthesis lauroyltransferase n=1 Tax=Paludisphaera borealis TaxID=1387353 RepID=A0A1U7CLH2_9BACT|nr:lauroyl acyltransferase [Paludisphaera borealis]APW59794.1 Lipid A biosynthesis lauroyltransferase [Paludisphaera borealis]
MDRRAVNIRKGFLRGVLPFVRLLPLPVASRFLSGIGRFEYRMSKGVRAAFDSAVSQGGKTLRCDWDVPAVGERLAGNHILWRSRDLLLDGPSKERALNMFDVEGREHLDAALAQKKGCVLLTSHFGAHMLPAHWLYRQDYPLRLYMERPRNVSKFMIDRFTDDGELSQGKLFISRRGGSTDAASSILRAVRVLRSGMMLFLAGDVRWSGQLTAEAHFMGQTQRFSTTWIALAAMSQAPVVPVFCRIGDDDRYHLEFQPSFQVPRDAQQEDKSSVYAQRFLDLLEEQVRRYPSNSNEYLFWKEPEESAV